MLGKTGWLFELQAAEDGFHYAASMAVRNCLDTDLPDNCILA